MAHHLLNIQSARIGSRGRKLTQTGDKVRFRISDVFLPNPDALLVIPPAEEEVEGTIIDFSDSGQKARFFALVDVVRRQTVVVPVEKLESASESGPEPKS